MTLDELVRWYLAHRVEQAGDCLLFTGHCGSAGYPKVQWNGHTHSLHRLVCEWQHGPTLFEGRQSHAMHRCGNKRCINPKHLEWGDAVMNRQDMLRHAIGGHPAP